MTQLSSPLQMIVLLQIIYQVAITSLTYSRIPGNKKGVAACFVFNCRCFKDHCAHAHARPLNSCEGKHAGYAAPGPTET
uniref:Secreted protein n=1 Tax=Poecilia latipinna TaxID=48699 RepID=A0A3B3TSI1_9TELE